MTYPTFKAGIVQFHVALGNIDANVSLVLQSLDRLGKERAGLAVLPEMWSAGFDHPRLAEHARATPEILDALSRTAARKEMVVAGSLPELADGAVYNTLYVVDADGSLAGAYRKVHLFSVTRENDFFGAGDRSVVCDTLLGRIGLMICYDLRFPELCRSLALNGAQVVVVPAQWPSVRIRRWDILAQARAIENQLFVVGVNRCGIENRTVFGGHSIVVDPSGEVILHAGDKPLTATAEIDLSRIEKVREFMPSLKERMPDAYDL